MFFEKSRQAYYQMQRRKDVISEKSEVIINLVKEYRRRMPKIGTRKLHHLLQPVLRQHSIKCGRDKLFSILAERQLLQPKHRASRCYTQSLPLSRHFPNHIKEMDIDAPEQVWVSDTTGLPVLDGISYLTLTTDSYSKRIMGYHVQRTKGSSGSLATLRMALGSRQYPEHQLIHHSDGGSEYFNHVFLQELVDAHVKSSCTAPSSPEENPVAERINGILKNEFLLSKGVQSFNQMETYLPEAVKIYNEERPHGSIDYMTPMEAHKDSGLLIKRWKIYHKHRRPKTNTISEGKRIIQEMDSWK